MSDPEYTIETSLVSVHFAEPGQNIYDLSTAAELAQLHPDIVLHYWRLGLLPAARVDAGDLPAFDDNGVYELRRIEHFHRHHGVNRQALPLVMRLVHDLERLQAEVRFLRSR